MRDTELDAGEVGTSNEKLYRTWVRLVSGHTGAEESQSYTETEMAGRGHVVKGRGRAEQGEAEMRGPGTRD